MFIYRKKTANEFAVPQVESHANKDEEEEGDHKHPEAGPREEAVLHLLAHPPSLPLTAGFYFRFYFRSETIFTSG